MLAALDAKQTLAEAPVEENLLQKIKAYYANISLDEVRGCDWLAHSTNIHL